MNADDRTNRTRDDDYPGINISRIRVGGDAGGLIFVVGTVVCLLIGLPAARTFLGLSLAGGVVVATLLLWWHRRRRAVRG